MKLLKIELKPRSDLIINDKETIFEDKGANIFLLYEHNGKKYFFQRDCPREVNKFINDCIKGGKMLLESRLNK